MSEELKSPSETGHKTIRRQRNGLITALIGYLLCLLGMKPDYFLLDRSPVIGFVQTAVLLIGLGIMCLGGYLALRSFWPRNDVSITADFGSRFVATGFVISLFTGMADVFGIGSHPLSVGVPYFGPLQSQGVVFGEGVIALGFVMMIFSGASKTSADEETEPKE